MVLTQEAEEYEEVWYTEETKQPPAKPFLYPTWKRRLDIVHKLGMILQCGKGLIDDWQVIPVDIAKYAVKLYEDLIKHYEVIIEGIIIGRNDRKMERVITVLRKYKTITQSKLLQNVSGYGIRSSELQLMINSLMEQDSVRKYNAPGGSKWIIEWIGE